MQTNDRPITELMQSVDNGKRMYLRSEDELIGNGHYNGNEK